MPFSESSTLINDSLIIAVEKDDPKSFEKFERKAKYIYGDYLYKRKLEEMLLKSAEFGSIKILKKLIYYGVDLNATDYGHTCNMLPNMYSTSRFSSVRETALNKSVENDKHEFLEILLESKANVNAVDLYGCSALHLGSTS